MENQTRALELLARIIGKKHRLEVVFCRDAQTAYTDGKTITLPMVTSLGTEDHAILVEGLLDHEAMHCRFTNYEVVYVSKTQRPSIVGVLTNIFEDVWGEREQGKIYPGCAKNINRAIDVMIKMGWFRGPVTGGGSQPDPSSLLIGYLLCGLRGRYQSKDLCGMALEYKAFLERLMGTELVQKIWTMAVQVDHVSSTAQALALADEIFKLLCQYLSDEVSQNAVQTIVTATADDEQKSGDLGTMICDALKSEGRVIPGNIGENYRVIPPPQLSLVRKEDRDLQEEAIRMSRNIEVTLGTKLETLLETRTDSFVMHKKSGSRLEARRVPRVAMGKLDVFRCVEEGESVDTAVHVLMDCSQSMFGSSSCDPTANIVAASAVTYAAAQVLNRYNVPFAFSCFGRFHSSIKKFQDNWAVAKQLCFTKDMGCTSTQKAVSHITQELVCRSEARKLVILITDGAPNEVEATLVVMREAHRLGIEFAILFVGSYGEEFESQLQNTGYRIARSLKPGQLATALFEAVKSAF